MTLTRWYQVQLGNPNGSLSSETMLLAVDNKVFADKMFVYSPETLSGAGSVESAAILIYF